MFGFGSRNSKKVNDTESQAPTKGAKDNYNWPEKPDVFTKFVKEPIWPARVEFEGPKIQAADTIFGWVACFFLLLPLAASTSFYLWKDSASPARFPTYSLYLSVLPTGVKNLGDELNDSSRSQNQRRNVLGAVSAPNAQEGVRIPRLLLLTVAVIPPAILVSYILALLFNRSLRKRQYDMSFSQNTKKSATKTYYFLRPAPCVAVFVPAVFWANIYQRIWRQGYTIGPALQLALAGGIFCLIWLVLRFWRTWLIYKWGHASEKEEQFKTAPSSPA